MSGVSRHQSGVQVRCTMTVPSVSRSGLLTLRPSGWVSSCHSDAGAVSAAGACSDGTDEGSAGGAGPGSGEGGTCLDIRSRKTSGLLCKYCDIGYDSGGITSVEGDCP